MQKEINGVLYSFGKIDAVTQFHVMRRLAPVMGGFFAGASAFENLGKSDLGDDIAEKMKPFFESLQKLSDEDANYVLFKLLGKVQVKNDKGGGGFVNISTGFQLMMQDMDTFTMIRLAFESGKENMQGFLNALPSALKAGAQV